MKRLYLTFITALFLCAIAFAKDINVGGFHYRILNDKEVAVIGAEVNDTVLRIPSTVSIQNKQYTVVEVANKKPEKDGKDWGSYKNQYWGAETKDIIIPQTVKNIRAGAFYYNSFRNIYLPEEMEYISNYAFCGCTIGYIRFPKRINFFLYDAFKNSNIGALDFRNTECSTFDIDELRSIRYFRELFLPQGIKKVKSESQYNAFLKSINSLGLSIDGNTIKNSLEDNDIKKLFEKVTELQIRNIEKIDFRVLENFPNLKVVYLTKPLLSTRFL